LTVTRERLAGVGAFVIAGVVLFAIAVFMIGDRQMAFSRRVAIYTEFRTITGLQPGAIVRVSGAKAGSVQEIEPPADPSGKFRVRLEITEDLHQLVRTDSVATIQVEGLVGGSFLAVSMGSAAAPRAAAGSTIPSREPFLLADLFDQMSETIRMVNVTIAELRGGIEKALTSVDTTVESANALLSDVSGDVKAIASAGARISGDAAAIAEGIRKGEGTVGKLMKDDELYNRATRIVKTAEDIAANTKEAVQQARQALEKLQSYDGQVTGVTASLKETIESTRAAMAGLSANMDALKRNFLVRGYFNRRGYFTLAEISPDEYRKGALTDDGDRRAVRVWLRADVLFEGIPGEPPGKPGAERLTDDGRARLDSALAATVSRLADGVLMVEGYSQDGLVAEQYLTSRARAALVRDYLIGRFHLDPDAVGLMPLGRKAMAESPAGDVWNGIALAAFLGK
jgi:phospholipid/cholesterol/gamma-HCH transport system substrate-binding protein